MVERCAVAGSGAVGLRRRSRSDPFAPAGGRARFIEQRSPGLARPVRASSDPATRPPPPPVARLPPCAQHRNTPRTHDDRADQWRRHSPAAADCARAADESRLAPGSSGRFRPGVVQCQLVAAVAAPRISRSYAPLDRGGVPISVATPGPRWLERPRHSSLVPTHGRRGRASGTRSLERFSGLASLTLVAPSAGRSNRTPSCVAPSPRSRCQRADRFIA